MIVRVFYFVKLKRSMAVWQLLRSVSCAPAPSSVPISCAAVFRSNSIRRVRRDEMQQRSTIEQRQADRSTHPHSVSWSSSLDSCCTPGSIRALRSTEKRPGSAVQREGRRALHRSIVFACTVCLDGLCCDGTARHWCLAKRSQRAG